MNLLFARHGQASFGQKNYDKLSELGEKQAALLGKYYAMQQRQIDAVITGAMVRQQDSARYFLREFTAKTKIDIKTNVIAGLNEFNHEDVLIKSDPAFNQPLATNAGIMAEIAKADVPKKRLGELFNAAMLRWHTGEHDEDYIESWTAFHTRVQNALQAVIDHAKQKNANTVLVFTSGGVIASITSSLLLSAHRNDTDSLHPNQRMLALQINQSLVNTGVTTVTVKPSTADDSDKLKLLSLNEHGHLYQHGKSLLTWH